VAITGVNGGMYYNSTPVKFPLLREHHLEDCPDGAVALHPKPPDADANGSDIAVSI